MSSIAAALLTLAGLAQETVWVEAEHLEGVRGYCWPMGKAPKTDGHWALSGPGWAAEWTQGGESEFLSIACGPADDQAVAGIDVDIPVAGAWRLWVRYRDARELSERFEVRLTPPGARLAYGERAVIEEDNEMKLYWNWAFAWDARDVELPKGKVRLELRSAFAEKDCRQIDCFVLTTDAAYRPLMKDRPAHPTWKLLEELSRDREIRREPLARRASPPGVAEAWKPRTFREKGFLYLWNMSHTKWAGGAPDRVPVPYHVSDAHVREAFEKKYAGVRDVPIFSDPRIVPVFHGAGPYILSTDATAPAKREEAEGFVRWLEAHPDRPWGLMMNYQPDVPLTAAARERFFKHRDRYVGSISGENLGYFEGYLDAAALKAATAGARSRRELVEAFSPVALAANAAKYRKIFGQEAPDAYREVVACKSIGMTAFAPICFQWGARTVGYESSAHTSSLLSLRMAFLRGAARQNGGLTATYRSCNFGDASTIFSDTFNYSKPGNILDNFYTVYSGAGMTWYKMDLWHQYMSGSSMFYHEQGFDEFWMPGGTGAAPRQDVQLSPKGKLVDRFLRVTAAHPDRGTPYTPIAFLLDYAHGWDPAAFEPHAFGNYGRRPDLTLYGRHERQLREYFWVAYHPIGLKAQEATTSTNEGYVPGVWGDIFDVVYAYPDLKRWTTLSTYPVVIAAGDLELTRPEGERLAAYVDQGGTLVVAEGHVGGAGVESLALPPAGELAEASGYEWTPTGGRHAAQRFRYRPLEGGRVLARTSDGSPFCVSLDRGQGRLIYLSVPRGLGIDGTAVPVLAQLVAHLRSGLLPVEVFGDVEWLLNAKSDGWIVTLLNPAGQVKPQQGITPTDYRENRRVRIRVAGPVRAASDWLFPEEPLTSRSEGESSVLELTVPAGGVRVVELKSR